MKALAVLLAVLALGCAGQPVPAQPPKAQTKSSTETGWNRWELPLAGLSAEFPVKPNQFETQKQSETGSIATSSLVATHAERLFGVGYTQRDGVDRPPDDAWIEGIRKSYKDVERFERVGHGDFNGVILWRNVDGKRIAGWYLLVGDGFVSAFVSADRAKFDDALARRFFDSVRFELPWRVYPAPSGMLSIAVPAAAVEIPGAKLEYAADGPSRAFFVGGKHDLIFIVGTVELDATMASQEDDDILSTVLANFAAQGAVMHWQSPIAFDGARALDYLAESKGVQIRGRLLRVAHYLYSLEIRARSRTAVLDDRSKRFLESLRWY